jgi:hypothetical protein
LWTVILHGKPLDGVIKNVDAVMELMYRDPWRLPETAQNVELLQLCGVEDKPGLQVHLHAIVECLFGLASSFFTLLSEDVGVGSVNRDLSYLSQSNNVM